MKDDEKAFSPRELQVLKLIAMGVSGREISRHLGFELKTYDTHRGHIMAKLGIRGCGSNASALMARYAIENNLVEINIKPLFGAPGAPPTLDSTGVPT